MSQGISWKEFEAIVAKLQSTFNKAGVVTRNEKILGKTSRRSRQIDVSIRTTVGTEEVLIVVECKKWNRKADVQAVEAFAGVKKDVGAQMGIMVSTAGFSKAAYQRATAEGISLYKYQDTQKENWPSGLETSALLEIWELTPTVACFILADGTEEPILTDEDLNFIPTGGKEPGRLASVLRKIWDSCRESDRREWSWMQDYDCTTTERPEIRKLRIGAESKFVRGIRKGRLHFEGLVSEAAGEAKVQAWKMVFDGEMVPWPKEKPLPPTETYSILLKSVFVKSQNVNAQTLQGLIYKGVFEITVTNKNVIRLPVKSPFALKLGSVLKAKPLKTRR
jgi:hypothetical protein